MAKKSRTPSLPVIAAVVAGVATAGAAAAVVLRRRAGASGPAVPPPGSAPDTTPAADRLPQVWHHSCGQELRVSGEGRHRVFWTPEAAMADPILDDRCPGCGGSLISEPVTADT